MLASMHATDDVFPHQDRDRHASQGCVVNDGIFIQVVGMDQKYRGRTFSWPICFIVASFWTTFHTVLEGTTLEMYSQSTRGPKLFFLQVV